MNDSQTIPTQTPPRPANAVTLLWILIVIFSLLRFVHLSADFPNDTPWAADQAKFTDEGWWASSAITHHLTGQWTIPGDYNPSAAVPLWTALLTLVFRASGISLLGARALSVLFSVASIPVLYLVARRGTSTLGDSANRLPATIAALLLATSSFAFVFARLAILDSCVLFQFCLLFLVAGSMTAHRPWPRLLALAILVASVVLTKTTAVTLIPAVAWFEWSALGLTLPNLVAVVTSSAVLPAALLGVWYCVVRTTGHLTDLNYFFEINSMDPFHRSVLPQTLLHLAQNALWIDPILVPLSLGFVLLACFKLRCLWRNPLFSAAVVALCCHTVYLIRRQDDAAPRYFLPLLIPIILIVVLGLSAFLKADRQRKVQFWKTLALGAFLGLSVSAQGFTIIDFVLHPTFSLIGALTDIQRIVAANQQQRRLVLGVSAADLSLATGIPALNDAFGSEDLADKVERLQPGWFLAWNGVGDDIRAALPNDSFVPVSQYSVFDDPDRSTLILYRLVPNRPALQPPTAFPLRVVIESSSR